MVRGFRMLLATLMVAGVTAGIAAAGGGHKFPLLGPAGFAACDGSGVLGGTAGGYGFAIIRANRATVGTSVSIKQQQPNTTYQIRLIQGVADCGAVDTTVTTNSQGNGTVRWSEASVSSTAFVAVDPVGGGNHFVTATLHH
jgi:hypothetical protein